MIRDSTFRNCCERKRNDKLLIFSSPNVACRYNPLELDQLLFRILYMNTSTRAKLVPVFASAPCAGVRFVTNQNPHASYSLPTHGSCSFERIPCGYLSQPHLPSNSYAMHQGAGVLHPPSFPDTSKSRAFPGHCLIPLFPRIIQCFVLSGVNSGAYFFDHHTPRGDGVSPNTQGFPGYNRREPGTYFCKGTPPKITEHLGFVLQLFDPRHKARPADRWGFLITWPD